MPRVLIVSPEFPPWTTGGLGTHLMALSTGLAARGWTIDVILPCKVGDDPPSEPVESHGARVHVVNASEATRAHHPSSRRSKTAYAEDLRAHAAHVAADTTRGPVDLIHLHDWFMGPIAAALRETLRVPLLTSIHLLYNPAFTWWGQKLHPDVIAAEAAVCRGADRLITVSRAMADLIAMTYDVRRDRVTVVHNGLDPASVALFAPPADRVDPPPRLVVFAGRIAAQKGIVPLLRSASLVLDRIPDARWALAGPSVDTFAASRNENAEIDKALAADPRLASAVTLTGALDRSSLAALYARAAVAVVPSIYEPFGYAALEAMCAELPVVASDVGGLSEIVEDDKTGILVPMVEREGLRAPDIEALARAQISLLAEPARGRAMGAAGRVRALEQFPPEKMIEETAAVYGALIK